MLCLPVFPCLLFWKKERKKNSGGEKWRFKRNFCKETDLGVFFFSFLISTLGFRVAVDLKTSVSPRGGKPFFFNLKKKSCCCRWVSFPCLLIGRGVEEEEDEGRCSSKGHYRWSYEQTLFLFFPTYIPLGESPRALRQRVPTLTRSDLRDGTCTVTCDVCLLPAG